jgi:hypothetical protein
VEEALQDESGDGRCLLCGKPLPFLVRLRKGQFCSPHHEREYGERQAAGVLSRITQFRRRGGGSALCVEQKVRLRSFSAAQPQPQQEIGRLEIETPMREAEWTTGPAGEIRWGSWVPPGAQPGRYATDGMLQPAESFGLVLAPDEGTGLDPQWAEGSTSAVRWGSWTPPVSFRGQIEAAAVCGFAVLHSQAVQDLPSTHDGILPPWQADGHTALALGASVDYAQPHLLSLPRLTAPALLALPHHVSSGARTAPAGESSSGNWQPRKLGVAWASTLPLHRLHCSLAVRFDRFVISAAPPCEAPEWRALNGNFVCGSSALRLDGMGRRASRWPMEPGTGSGICIPPAHLNEPELPASGWRFSQRQAPAFPVLVITPRAVERIHLPACAPAECGMPELATAGAVPESRRRIERLRLPALRLRIPAMG